MFALGLEFLSWRYYGSAFSDRSRPEWPPHPDRLFSAFVAACHRAGGRGREALLWLERQGSPHIWVARRPRQAGEGRRILAMVPVNDDTGPKALPPYRSKRPRYFPSILAQEPVYYAWPQSSPPEEVRKALLGLAYDVAYLGSSRSPVRIWIEDAPPPPNLIPARDGREILRVPTAGRLEELEHLYRSGFRPTLAHQERYRWKEVASEEDRAVVVPARALEFGHMYVLARKAGPTPGLEAALTVTSTLRRALIRIAAGGVPSPDQVEIPSLLHGHGRNRPSHAAFLALPHVGSQYSDGHLLGVAILFPTGTEVGERLALLRAVAQLRQIESPAGPIELEPVTDLFPDEVPWGLRVERWAGPGSGTRTWTSVTPVLFDRFPKPNRGGILGAVQIMAAYAGLPRVVSATASPWGALPGVPPARQFRVRRSEDEPVRFVSHLTVSFERPIVGPVLMGAGRHFGLGLFAPYPQGKEKPDATEL